MWRVINVLFAIGGSAVAIALVHCANSKDTVSYFHGIFAAMRFDFSILEVGNGLFYAGVGLQIVIVALPYAYYIYLSDKLKRQRDKTIASFKKATENGISRIMGIKTDYNINVRIFLPDKSIMRRIREFFGHKPGISRYRIKNIPGLCSVGLTDNLYFEVDPNSQGIVGACYNHARLVYDNAPTLGKTTYNMTEYQKSITQDVNTCICVPILDSADNIFAIVSYDSTETINLVSLKNRRKVVFEKLVTHQSISLYEYFPFLFK